MIKVREHKHPLELIDLQQEKEEDGDDDDDDDDGGGDLTMEEVFRSCTCGRCKQEINMYQRYYYKCIISSCDYSIHKFCVELSTRLVHPSHPHSLTLIDDWQFSWNCSICRSFGEPQEMLYKCSSCEFWLDINCAVEARKKIIYHPCHAPHLLVSAIRQPILCRCGACGKKHEGVFYQCPTCDTFAIHKDCAFLPKKLLFQQTTHDAFYHSHPLTISYSFPEKDQKAKYYPKCRVCGKDFRDYFIGAEYLWTYKCDKCMYYAHVDCATSLPVAGYGKTIKNFKDADHPHLLHLPSPDVSYSLPKHLLFEESTSRAVEVNLKHNSHQHPLILVDQTSSKINSLLCHNPMKKIQLLCNGCVRPITTTPFFKCADEDEHCNFALHEWCTRLPEKIENHPDHSQHTLFLMLNTRDIFFGESYECASCRLPCNGFAYCCIKCKYYVDVMCGLIPAEITHKVHPNHLLSVVHTKYKLTICRICNQRLYRIDDVFQKLELIFGCKECDIYMHSTCALSFFETVRHKYDIHPMYLSYLPIENHTSEYFCEICEEGLNPHEPFYHCQDCAQSIHTACAPSILQSETETYTYHWHPRSVHEFINMKFGGIHNTNGHPHPLSFAQGTVLDGQCSKCGEGLRNKMIFKCLEGNPHLAGHLTHLPQLEHKWNVATTLLLDLEHKHIILPLFSSSTLTHSHHHEIKVQKRNQRLEITNPNTDFVLLLLRLPPLSTIKPATIRPLCLLFIVFSTTLHRNATTILTSIN